MSVIDVDLATLETHPLIAGFPEMGREEFDGFVADIDAVGMRDPIVLLDDDGVPKVIDGRHRIRARRQLGRPLAPDEVIIFDPSWGDPLDWVISRMHSRSRTPSIKAAEAVLVLERTPPRQAKGRTLQTIARRLGIGEGIVEFARQVRAESPELFGAICNGKLKVKVAHARLRHRRREQQVRKLRTDGVASSSDFRLIHGHNLDEVTKLPDASVRVVFADPPYNNGWTYRDDPAGDRKPDSRYLADLGDLLLQCGRVLTDDGSIFLVIDDTYLGEFIRELKLAGFTVRRVIVWWETFGNYHSAEGNLSPACRFVIYAAKSDKPFFNTVELRDPSARLATYKDKRANPHGKIPDSVWHVPRITGNHAERVPWQDKGQAPQLPIAVPERCVLLASEPGDTVLDPYNGNGTTGIAALRNGRKYVGIDRDAVGLRRSEQWINQSLQEARDAAK